MNFYQVWMSTNYRNRSGGAFINDVIKHLKNHFLLKHVSFTIYFPQGNGQVKSTNKVLGTLLTKFVTKNKINWDEHLPTILFSYRTTYKVATRYTPYELVYGLHPLMPIEYILLIIGSNHIEGNLVKVLTSKVSKLEKLQEDKLQFEVKLRI